MTIVKSISEKQSRFLWSFHHIVLDGWSVRLIFDEVLRLYGRRSHDPLLPSAVPFAAFVNWLDKVDPIFPADFWTTLLQGFVSATPLPAAYTTPVAAERKGPRKAALKRELSADLSKRLAAVARDNRLTMNSMLVGAWAILLGQYSGYDDIVAVKLERRLEPEGQIGVVFDH